jgi:hypothetical protein
MRPAVIATLVAGSIILCYDVYALAVNGYDATISYMLYTAGAHWQIIPFSLGVLAGHLFFPNDAANVTKED